MCFLPCCNVAAVAPYITHTLVRKKKKGKMPMPTSYLSSKDRPLPEPFLPSPWLKLDLSLDGITWPLLSPLPTPASATRQFERKYLAENIAVLKQNKTTTNSSVRKNKIMNQPGIGKNNIWLEHIVFGMEGERGSVKMEEVLQLSSGQKK